MLAEKLEVIEKGVESRVMLKVEAKRKKKASASKKSKRKYKALAEKAAGSMSAGHDSAQNALDSEQLEGA